MPKGFQKGVSGNPGGRSRIEKPWTEALKKELAKLRADETGILVGKLALLARRCVDAGLDGDTIAIKEIGNRLDGLPAQQQIITGDPDAPLVVKWDT